MPSLRLLLLAALLAGSCAGQAPSAPTEVQAGFATAEEQAADQLATFEIDPEQLNAAAAKTFVVSGVVTDKAYPAWKVSAASITVTPGSLRAKTTSAGKYTVKGRAGTYTIKIAKAGYTTATIRKAISRSTTINVALKPVTPRGATARCKDRTWSKSQTRRGTCSHHKGVAYWVCPGRLC